MSYEPPSPPSEVALFRMQSIAIEPHSAESAATYLKASLSEGTKRSYRFDLARFEAWGGSIPSLPAAVAEYVATLAPQLSPHTLQRHLAAITKAHAVIGAPNPCASELVRATMRGIRRVHGTAQRRVAPLLREDILAIADSLPDTARGCRDRALLLVGFAAALRRSELVALYVEDVRFVSDGIVLRLARSKTDQEGEGRDIGIPHGRTRACPVKAIRAWLALLGAPAGPLFRPVGKGGRIGDDAMTAQSVALIVKERASAIGLAGKDLAGHSLRAGLITSAAKIGVSSWKIRQQSGHRSEAMLARYVRDGELFVDNAAGAVL